MVSGMNSEWTQIAKWDKGIKTLYKKEIQWKKKRNVENLKLKLGN